MLASENDLCKFVQCGEFKSHHMALWEALMRFGNASDINPLALVRRHGAEAVI
jgi:hypothetical protein